MTKYLPETEAARALFEAGRRRALTEQKPKSLLTLFDSAEEADPQEARRRIDASASRVVAKRASALRACQRWEQIGRFLPPTECHKLFVDLLFLPDSYERDRLTRKRSAGGKSQDLAKRLCRELKNSEGAPGLSLLQRDTLIGLLERLSAGQRVLISDIGKAMPERPGRSGAKRTFVIRLIKVRLQAYSPSPLHSSIADLAEAALGVVVTRQDVRDALKGWKGE